MSIDVEALATAMAVNGIVVENITSIGTADQWLPDRKLAASIAAEYARLVLAEDEGRLRKTEQRLQDEAAIMAWPDQETAERLAEPWTDPKG